MSRSKEDAQIIRNLEDRLADMATKLHWYETELSHVNTERIESLIRIMEEQSFQQWFERNMIRENSAFGDAVTDLVDDHIDYSDSFRERVNDIFQTELYELKDDLRSALKVDVENEVNYKLSVGDPEWWQDIIKEQLKKLNLKVMCDE